MANELSLNYLTGQTIKALVWGKNRTTRWNGSAMAAPSTIADVDWATGMIAMTEQVTSDSTGTGQYVGSLPSTGITGEHQVDYLLGATPTPGQERIGYQAADTQDIGNLQVHGDSTWATADVSGAATTEALAAAKTVIDTIATDTGETIPAAITGSSLGTGARTIAVTVNDGSTALQSARVRFTKGAESYIGTTNATGQIAFSLDDGTWSVAITLAGYSFTPTTLVVNSDETQTYSMMLVTATPSESGKVTGYWYTIDEDGVVEASVNIELRVVSSSLTGTAHDAAIRTETSDSNGLVQFTNLVKGAKYEARRGTAMRWTQFSVATTATTPYALPDIWGSEA